MADETEEWGPNDFNRRHYEIQGDLEGAKMQVMVKMDGRPWMTIELREPGVLALVSRPDRDGIDVELIGPGGVRYTDIRMPSGSNQTMPMPQWAHDALFGPRDSNAYVEPESDEG